MGREMFAWIREEVDMDIEVGSPPKTRTDRADPGHWSTANIALIGREEKNIRKAAASESIGDEGQPGMRGPGNWRSGPGEAMRHQGQELALGTRQIGTRGQGIGELGT